MIARRATYIYRQPGRMLVELEDGKKYTCRLYPPRELTPRDLLPARSDQRADGWTLPAREARCLYGLQYVTIQNRPYHS